MTDEQIIEQAARHLCGLRGLDPDTQVPAPSTDLVYRTRPAWRQAAEEIIRHLQVQEAIAAVGREP